MITDAIASAYETMRSRNWDTIYWAVDLHGVCLESNYKEGVHAFISEEAIQGLQMISSFPESKVILWSSVYDENKPEILELFAQHGIKVHGFNENSTAPDTHVSSFKEKFYFSILLDDKAGFRPERDWPEIVSFLHYNRDHLLNTES